MFVYIDLYVDVCVLVYIYICVCVSNKCDTLFEIVPLIPKTTKHSTADE